MGRLVAFHAKHKLLMLSYNQSRMRALGSLVANLSKRPKKDVFMDYAEQLPLVFRKPSKKSNNLNVLQHSLGYFKKTSGPEEKQFFFVDFRGIHERFYTSHGSGKYYQIMDFTR